MSSRLSLSNRMGELSLITPFHMSVASLCICEWKIIHGESPWRDLRKNETKKATLYQQPLSYDHLLHRDDAPIVQKCGLNSDYYRPLLRLVHLSHAHSKSNDLTLLMQLDVTRGQIMFSYVGIFWVCSGLHGFFDWWLMIVDLPLSGWMVRYWLTWPILSEIGTCDLGCT